ncbi:hypothetical protein C0993_005098 [Termitomyces sp. T159_Od127]|nr:hypothetical protein C0993_005098 [Termitomyces sp. T159_Od127]
MSPPDKASASAASTSKRASAKSLRGVPRAKSGCYTCRIRRKVRISRSPWAPPHPAPQKCDEQPDEQGRCATCVRLRLECLGFGAKRPEWLRLIVPNATPKESRTVAEIREKIKVFLASQGMVKGYSGTPHQGFSFQDHGQQYYATASALSPAPSAIPPIIDPPDPYYHPTPATTTASPPQRYKPISFGRGTQHLLNQDDIVPERPRASTSYFRSTAEDPYDRRCDDSVSDHTFSEVSEGDKVGRQRLHVPRSIRLLLLDRAPDFQARRPLCEQGRVQGAFSMQGISRTESARHVPTDVMYDPPPRFERHLIVATQKLAARSGLYPTCHELGAIDLTMHDRPLASGDFFDIYKAAFRGRVICLKVLRLDRTTNSEHFLKARFYLFWWDAN